MDDRPIDLSVLDPSRDQPRWARLVDEVAARAVARHRERRSIAGQLTRWARPVLALAAGLCLLTWAGGWLGGRATSITAPSPAAFTLASWAANHQTPTPDALLQTLGGN